MTTRSMKVMAVAMMVSAAAVQAFTVNQPTQLLRQLSIQQQKEAITPLFSMVENEVSTHTNTHKHGR